MGTNIFKGKLLLAPAAWLSAMALAPLLVWDAPAAHAGLACGDTIEPGPPVLLRGNIGPCQAPGPALKIIGPVVVNLNGAVIACGAAITGIEVQGVKARIMNGVVENCQDGVIIDGDGEHQILKVTVSSPAGAVGDRGFLVRSDHNHLIANLADGFNGEGFRFDGDGNRAVINRAEGTTTEGFRINGGGNRIQNNLAKAASDHGFRVTGDGNLLFNNQAHGNEGEGFRLDGNGNQLVRNGAVDNADEGFRIRDGQDNTLTANQARGNGASDDEAGIRIQEDGNTLRGNAFIDNFGDGILVVFENAEEAAENNTIVGNVAVNNGGIDLVDQNTDCDNNEWSRNRFRTRSQDCIH